MKEEGFIMRTLFAAAVTMACVTALVSQTPGPARAAAPGSDGEVH